MRLVRFDPSPSRRVLRTFGLSLVVTGGILAALAGLWGGRPVLAATLGGVFGLAGLVPALAPGGRAARLVHRGFSIPALAVGNVVSVVLVAVFFLLLVTPIGLLRRLFGGDPLRLRRGGETYWVEVDEAAADYERQF